MMIAGRSSYLWRNHSLPVEDEAESPRQGQTLHGLVRSQRLFAALSETHSPAFSQTGCTR